MNVKYKNSGLSKSKHPIHYDRRIDENLNTILVVEDNDEVRNFLKGLFIEKYNIFEAENDLT